MEHDNEPEVIREQMQETRESLTEKLETLEQQVVGTVQGATAAVTDTVENVKEAVQETVDTVRDSVQGTVETVKETFNLPRQVERHPWPMMGGSFALGYLSGWASGRPGHFGWSPWRRTSSSMANWISSGDGERAAPHASPETSGDGTFGAGGHAARPGWFSSVSNLFGSEFGKLKRLAIGALVASVRDAVTDAVPEQMRHQVQDVMNDVTLKLGGEPFHDRILSTRGHPGAFSAQEERAQSPHVGGGEAREPVYPKL